MSDDAPIPEMPPVEWMPVVCLRPHPKNYRTHPEDQLKHIAQSIHDHGFYRNVVVANDYTILAGHGVVAAVEFMGMFGPQTVPVLRLPVGPDDPMALKVLIGDNELGRLAEIDDRQLTNSLKEVFDALGLDGTGYDPARLAALIYTTRPESEIKDFNAAAHWTGMPDHVTPEASWKVVVNCATEDDRKKVLDLLGIKTIHRQDHQTASTWWPERKRQDLDSVKWLFDDEGDDDAAAALPDLHSDQG